MSANFKTETTDAKQRFFTHVLERLKNGAAYFSTDAVRAAAKETKLPLTDGTLKVYLAEAVAKGLIHSAGRGWYSRLSERVVLDPKPVAKLVRAVEKAFPLLDFCVWSTVQLNPWMHHLLARPVHFVLAPEDNLESIGDRLRSEGWVVAVNPPASVAAKSIQPDEKMVVLRPSLSRQPKAEKHQASIEQILVDLIAETAPLSLMDSAEAQAVVDTILNRYLMQFGSLQRYAATRKNPIEAISAVNQRHSKSSSDVS
jgi:hypothetical protein